MAIKQILQSTLSGGANDENTMLCQISHPVVIFDKSLSLLINDLRDTMWAYPICHGLSAPQIGVRLAVSVINFSRSHPSEDLVLINPIITNANKKTSTGKESCMSVWGLTGDVERKSRIKIEYQDIFKKNKRAAFEGFFARLVQHEIDHLNGILFTEKLVITSFLTKTDLFDGYNILCKNGLWIT